MSWPEGIEAINRLIAEHRIERVQPNQEGAQAFLDAASQHISSARTLADSDPEMAHTALYDAARKCLTALLLTQGLRPTTTGGHLAVEEAVNAQFTKPPPKSAFRPFRRMRQSRHQAEYNHVQALDAEQVLADIPLVETLHAVASQIMPALPVFTG